MTSTPTYTLAPASQAHSELVGLGWQLIPDAPLGQPGAIAVYQRSTRPGAPTRVALVCHGGVLALEPVPLTMS